MKRKGEEEGGRGEEEEEEGRGGEGEGEVRVRGSHNINTDTPYSPAPGQCLHSSFMIFWKHRSMGQDRHIPAHSKHGGREFSKTCPHLLQ